MRQGDPQKKSVLFRAPGLVMGAVAGRRLDR
ncbi:hypothetical protein GGE45_001479 [Rhizobium aethiopicum]|uniref:Uncharacterized protein n=1 Tax=Rhizobium aethiopicum TaxID=1138170 RepID=A0A7W6Q9J8_9HYPH|nr:hypothetical protein [Rhizobium aethiopicum]MBB4579159.1 hypothetical protein [Rhizobium aethiopicum]